MNKIQLFVLFAFLSWQGNRQAAAQVVWSPISGIHEPVQSLYEYQNTLYIGKLHLNVSGGMNKWDGTSLHSVAQEPNGAVTSFINMNNELIVCGGFTNAGGAPAGNVVKFDGSSKWTALGTQLYSFSINAVAIYNGELYAGGFSFDSLQKPVSLIMVKWNGTSWVSVGGGITGGDIYSMAVYKNDLYVAGSFTNAGGNATPMIAKWNGATWSKVGSGTTTGDVIYALKEYNGELYAGGRFSSIGGATTSCIAKWNGTIWSNVGGAGTDRGVFALGTDGANLYAGGSFNSVSGVPANHIARWNSNNWYALGSGVGIPNESKEQVFTITVYKGDIYAGGMFTQVEGKPAANLAKMNAAAAVGTVCTEVKTEIFPNPIDNNTIIQVTTQSKTELMINIYDILGREIMKVFNGTVEKGDHKFDIGNLMNMSPGVYTAAFVMDDKHFTKQIVLN